MESQTIEYTDRPPSGWFPLEVMREEARSWDWVCLMTDVEPDDLKHCTCESPVWLYVHPDEYRPQEGRVARKCWVRVPGKHRNRDAAWNALEALIATRH